MKYFIPLYASIFFNFFVYAQKEKTNNQKFVIGLSAPELLHIGYTYRLTNSSLLGLNVGAGPTLGSIFPTISFEHRLYLGKNDERIKQKTLFIRQGSTYFPTQKSEGKFSLNLSGGKDFLFKNIKNGITIDAGVSYLPNSERSSVSITRSLNLIPALRVQFYCFL